ncbi:MAG: hypothetical protein QGG64_18365, partial [Candidatus Latescibacteria bacterium]|nr:hypothetical protein [Candidatus Latescibacterota bacterium]
LGALAVIIVWGLWTARHHLKDVVQKALFNTPSIDDSQELLSYRTAICTLIISALYIAGWCIASGMSVGIAFVFLTVVFIVWMGITRITIETGLISCRTIQAQLATYHLTNITGWHPASIVAMTLTRTWHHDLKTILMAPMGNATKLFDDLRSDRFRLVLAVAIAIIVVAGGSAYYAIVSGYETGAYNYGGIYRDSVQNTFNSGVTLIRDPFALKREMALWGLLGFITTLLTAFLRYRLPWWPLHPIGFVSATTYPANLCIFSIFIAWFAKLIILRTGGILLYRKAAPFFFGLMLGYFTGVGISFVVDMIWFPERGHSLALY